MARSDNDTWDITESVGATALGVAASRATETERENPLISDPFARVFIDAAGEGIWNMFGVSELPAEIAEAEPDVARWLDGRVDYMAARTAFFDEFFLDAAEAGVRRRSSWRQAWTRGRTGCLPWPEGMRVYELDQRKVLEFKSSTLRQHGAQPTCHRVEVAVDCATIGQRRCGRTDLTPRAPSVWSAEGLLPFLPAAAQDLLFERVQALTVAGSRIAVEAPGPAFNDPDARERQAIADATLPRGRGESGRARDSRLRGPVVPGGPRRRRRVVARPRLGRVGNTGRGVAGPLRPPCPEGTEDGRPRSVFVSAARSAS